MGQLTVAGIHRGLIQVKVTPWPLVIEGAARQTQAQFSRHSKYSIPKPSEPSVRNSGMPGEFFLSIPYLLKECELE
jgi:hypothetical protein